ncbi:nitroreductase family protein [Desulfosporosinus metallidurans]|uniref:Uncharacterized protein n=1 Tax=Desulfosporosinus metallidurans TaxID=1888891 RepID=A0A1Q8QY80_9FIRM|nr:nitroreductase family protein [Desulfosporosinus metallidurans]OLN32312.1 hypothetical protein DSOL_1918 [Desulfosporosinus metallidurans]
MNTDQERVDLQEILRKRVSLRLYAERPIKDEDKDLIIEAAMRVPTRLNEKDWEAMFASRAQGFNPSNTLGAKNFGQWMYARKTGSDYSAEMARSVRIAMENWRGNHMDKNEKQP